MFYFRWKWSTHNCRVHPDRTRAQKERTFGQKTRTDPALRRRSLHAPRRHHRAVTQRLRSDGHDAESLVRTSQASLRESSDHHPRHSWHLSRQEKCHEQSDQAAVDWTDKFSNVESRRGSERDRADLRARQNSTTCCSWLWHHQSPVPVDQNFAQSNPCVFTGENFFPLISCPAIGVVIILLMSPVS